MTEQDALAEEQKSALIPNKNFKPNPTLESIGEMMDKSMYECPPGPAFIPFNYALNFNKATLFIYLLTLMTIYDNWSLGAWIYLALHGNYGMIWTLKDLVFPDPAF